MGAELEFFFFFSRSRVRRALWMFPAKKPKHGGFLQIVCRYLSNKSANKCDCYSGRCKKKKKNYSVLDSCKPHQNTDDQNHGVGAGIVIVFFFFFNFGITIFPEFCRIFYARRNKPLKKLFVRTGKVQTK